MPRKANSEPMNAPIRGATLHPLRVVRRRLVSPSGAVVEVDVPVYPPFRLESPEERRRGRPGTERSGSRNGARRGRRAAGRRGGEGGPE